MVVWVGFQVTSLSHIDIIVELGFDKYYHGAVGGGGGIRLPRQNATNREIMLQQLWQYPEFIPYFVPLITTHYFFNPCLRH